MTKIDIIRFRKIANTLINTKFWDLNFVLLVLVFSCSSIFRSFGCHLKRCNNLRSDVETIILFRTHKPNTHCEVIYFKVEYKNDNRPYKVQELEDGLAGIERVYLMPCRISFHFCERCSLQQHLLHYYDPQERWLLSISSRLALPVGTNSNSRMIFPFDPRRTLPLFWDPFKNPSLMLLCQRMSRVSWVPRTHLPCNPHRHL